MYLTHIKRHKPQKVHFDNQLKMTKLKTLLTEWRKWILKCGFTTIFFNTYSIYNFEVNETRKLKYFNQLIFIRRWTCSLCVYVWLIWFKCLDFCLFTLNVEHKQQFVSTTLSVFTYIFVQIFIFGFFFNIITIKYRSIRVHHCFIIWLRKKSSVIIINYSKCILIFEYKVLV